MNTGRWLTSNAQLLEKAGITTGRLDCLVLLEDNLGKDRTHLLAHPDMELTPEQEKVLNKQAERRAKHEPLAYIRGKSEFYGREFAVNEHTLEPRPETETIVDLAKTLLVEQKKAVVADIGTGSGCIAISIALEFPYVKMFATDIDSKCIKTVKENSKKLQAEITVLQGDLLVPIKNQPIDLVLCNLPYVPTKYQLNKAATFEPKHAIFGGEDGLDYYRRLFAQLGDHDQKPGHILTESLPFQHKKLTEICLASNYRLIKTDDFIQLFEQNNAI